MFSMIGQCYRDSGRLAVRLPLLFALPAIAEMTQHVIEYRIGMFASYAGMQASAGDSGRMIYGQVKIVALFLMIYWVSRALAFGRGGARRIVGDARSAAMFAGVVLVLLALALVQQFGGEALRPWLGSPGLYATASIALFLLVQVLDTYLTPWKVGAALGNGALTIPASFRIMHGNFWWSFFYLLAVALPLLVVHYLLNFGGVGRPEALLWPMLAFDALFVGYMGIVIAAAYFLIARRAATSKGAGLT